MVYDAKYGCAATHVWSGRFYGGGHTITFAGGNGTFGALPVDTMAAQTNVYSSPMFARINYGHLFDLNIVVDAQIMLHSQIRGKLFFGVLAGQISGASVIDNVNITINQNASFGIYSGSNQTGKNTGLSLGAFAGRVQNRTDTTSPANQMPRFLNSSFINNGLLYGRSSDSNTVAITGNTITNNSNAWSNARVGGFVGDNVGAVLRFNNIRLAGTGAIVAGSNTGTTWVSAGGILGGISGSGAGLEINNLIYDFGGIEPNQGVIAANPVVYDWFDYNQRRTFASYILGFAFRTTANVSDIQVNGVVKNASLATRLRSVPRVFGTAWGCPTPYNQVPSLDTQAPTQADLTADAIQIATHIVGGANNANATQILPIGAATLGISSSQHGIFAATTGAGQTNFTSFNPLLVGANNTAGAEYGTIQVQPTFLEGQAYALRVIAQANSGYVVSALRHPNQTGGATASVVSEFTNNYEFIFGANTISALSITQNNLVGFVAEQKEFSFERNTRHARDVFNGDNLFTFTANFSGQNTSFNSIRVGFLQDGQVGEIGAAGVLSTPRSINRGGVFEAALFDAGGQSLERSMWHGSNQVLIEGTTVHRATHVFFYGDEIGVYTAEILTNQLFIQNATAFNREFDGTTVVQTGGTLRRYVLLPHGEIGVYTPQNVGFEARVLSPNASNVPQRVQFVLTGSDAHLNSLIEPADTYIVIVPRVLTISDAGVVSRYANGTNVVEVTGTLERMILGAEVTLEGRIAGTVAGDYAVTFILTGEDRMNFMLIQPNDITVTITE